MFHTFDIYTLLYLNCIRYLKLSVPFSLQLLKVTSIYRVWLKKAANSGNTNYFDCKLQTSNDESVGLVCYSHKKRENLHQGFASQSRVKIVGTKKKRFNEDTEDHCISVYTCKNYSCWSSVFPIQSTNGKLCAHCKANLRSWHLWDCRCQSEDNYEISKQTICNEKSSAYAKDR